MVQWSPPHQPAFDPSWLSELAEQLQETSSSTAQLVDLYLERRLETRVSRHGTAFSSGAWCHDGAASRWLLPGHTVMRSCNGVTSSALAGLLEMADRSIVVPRSPSGSTVPLTPPQEWEAWAALWVEKLEGSASIRCLQRRAVVLVEGAVVPVESPPLVTVHRSGSRPASLLAVWDHPDLDRWIHELAAPGPSRTTSMQPGSRVPVVFRSGAAGSVLHELLGHLLESDLVLEGSSPFAAAASAEVTDRSLSVTDDPTRWDLPGAFTADDEGVAARAAQLVEGGRLSALLCDRAGAARLDQPPGRGRRASCSQPPTPRMSNLVVTKGSAPADEIEQEVTRGIVVTRCGGATVDPVSGRLSVLVERGWEIRRGRRRRALAPVVLTGTALEVLASLAPAIGDDPAAEWRHGWCGKRGHVLPTGTEVPTLRFDGFTCA